MRQLNVDGRARNAFAAFLDRLAVGSSTDEDWDEYVIAHYRDEVLEEHRRTLVRLAIEAGEPFPQTNDHRIALRAWAEALRAPQPS
jgi:hypothetical protein